MSGGSDDAGSGARIALRPRGGRRAPQELFEDREYGIDHHRASLRQAGRASPRERGSGGVDGGGGRHGGNSLGGDVLDSGAAGKFGLAGALAAANVLIAPEIRPAAEAEAEPP